MSGTRRDTLALAIGSAATGLLAYVVFALTTRGLGAVEAAPVSVLWSYWAISGAALTFPVQHWITRTAAVHGEGPVGAALPRIGWVVLALSLTAGAVAALVREPLFGRADLWFPAMVSLVTLGSALIGVLRGTLTARRRLVAVAASMVAENAVRGAAAALLLANDAGDAVAYGLCLVAGHLVVLVWPTALLVRSSGTTSARGNPFTYLAGAGLAQLVSQVVLTGGPVVLALAHGSPAEVTALFAALALFRAPYVVALGVMPQVTSGMTRLVLDGRTSTLLRLRRVFMAGAVGGTALAAAGAALVGPWLLGLVFGEDVRIGSAEAAAVAAGCTAAVANLLVMVSALAQDRPVAVARAWATALAAGGLSFAVLGIEPFPRVIAAFLAAEVVAFGALLAVGRTARGTLRSAG